MLFNLCKMDQQPAAVSLLGLFLSPAALESNTSPRCPQHQLTRSPVRLPLCPRFLPPELPSAQYRLLFPQCWWKAARWLEGEAFLCAAAFRDTGDTGGGRGVAGDPVTSCWPRQQPKVLLLTARVFRCSRGCMEPGEKGAPGPLLLLGEGDGPGGGPGQLLF